MRLDPDDAEARSNLGTVLQMEHTVEFERRKVPAKVVKTPFFDPERKRNP